MNYQKEIGTYLANLVVEMVIYEEETDFTKLPDYQRANPMWKKKAARAYQDSFDKHEGEGIPAAHKHGMEAVYSTFERMKKAGKSNANRRERDSVMRSMGLNKVRGAVSGKTYWESVELSDEDLEVLNEAPESFGEAWIKCPACKSHNSVDERDKIHGWTCGNCGQHTIGTSKPSIKEHEIPEDHFKSGDKVRFRPNYAGDDAKGTFTVGHQGSRGPGHFWVGDKQGQGWFAHDYQVTHAGKCSQCSGSGKLKEDLDEETFAKNPYELVLKYGWNRHFRGDKHDIYAHKDHPSHRLTIRQDGSWEHRGPNGSLITKSHPKQSWASNFSGLNNHVKGLKEDEIAEVSPPGWSGTTRAMKSHPEISNPFKLAWWMKNRGDKPHYKPEKTNENWQAHSGHPAPGGETESPAHKSLTTTHGLKHDAHWIRQGFDGDEYDVHVNLYRHPDNFYGHEIRTQHHKDPSTGETKMYWSRHVGAGLVKKQGAGTKSLEKHLKKYPLPGK